MSAGSKKNTATRYRHDCEGIAGEIHAQKLAHTVGWEASRPPRELFSLRARKEEYVVIRELRRFIVWPVNMLSMRLWIHLG